ncbi:MAG TPA: FG-GAP-like repeat-containing protein, partial [Cyclobacteriaceae bacterium]|nr:FG-GAP-like repeat-containing protein [Cyclobacteriaceae bacterium]
MGTAVTIIGSNFSTTPANNIVFFGATRGTVTASTATQITVSVPKGATYKPISVTVNGLSGYSALPFIVTFPSSGGIDQNSFSAKTDFTINTTTSPGNQRELAVGDIDGDGNADMGVVTGNLTGTLSIFRNTSTLGVIDNNTFASKVDWAAQGGPSGLTIQDLDGDGKMDLVETSGSLEIFKNTASPGSITFSSLASNVEYNPVGGNGSAVGDLDRDGLPDIIAIGVVPRVSIFRNTSRAGGFIDNSLATAVDFTVGNTPQLFEIGDFDLDGKNDWVISDVATAKISVFRNIGSVGDINSNSFAPKVDFTTGGQPMGIAIGDLDADGKPDIVVANPGSNSVSVMQNMSSTGAMNFHRIDFSAGSGPNHVAIGDLDGDGKPDIATINSASNTVSVLRNISTSGSPSFNPHVDFPIGNNSSINLTRGIAIADIDGDSKPEILAGTTYVVSVLHNLKSGPSLTSFLPTAAGTGATVTITGTNFDATTKANNIVKFSNGVTATVTSSTSTTITVTVPTGAVTGPITVTVSGLTVASSSSFTVNSPSAPTITSFTPLSGLVGATVAIAGTNFDPTPSNNTVKFNGTTATVSTSTATSITTTVPAGATSGPISVTVGGQTATSAANFTISSNSTLVTITEGFATSYTEGGTLNESITVNDGSKVSKVVFYYRGISQALALAQNIDVTSSGSGNSYSKLLASTDLTDPIGLTFYFQVTDNVGNVVTSKTGRAYVKYLATSTSQVIPGLVFGSDASKYQIVSVPLALTDNTVLGVFKDLAKQSTPAAYDKTLWRLYEYASGDNQEFGTFTGFTTIDPGKGYWLIARNNATINPGEGTTVPVDDTGAFTVPLAPGWNLIGNPYNFSISWTDVLKFNTNPAGIGNLETFNNGTAAPNTDVLPRYQGGYVFNSTGNLVNLKIPSTRNTSLPGRIYTNQKVLAGLDQPHWEVDLVLTNGSLTNKMGGIGMDPSARMVGLNRFDEVGLPLPESIGMFELSYSNAEAGFIFNKKVVPTQNSFTWNFDIHRHGEKSDIDLVW